MMGVSDSEYTAEEFDKIQELRRRVAGELTCDWQSEDAFLISWLRVRRLKIDEAEAMLRKSLEWRRENKVDGILERESVPAELLKEVRVALLGMEPGTGCPIVLGQNGNLDIHRLVREYGMEQLVRLNILVLEYLTRQIMKECSEKAGKPVTRLILHGDVKGISFWQCLSRENLEMSRVLTKIVHENYPKIVTKIFVVNATNVFYVAFKLMKHFVPKSTLDKVEVLGTNVESWKAVMEGRIPFELLPKHWGGTLAGNDEYCSSSDIWLYGPPYVFSERK
jgi:metal transporter CNNM